MVNLELTEAELVFLQRLIGYNMTWGSPPENLYDKLVDKTNLLGITSHKPLKLKDVSKESWYSSVGDGRTFLELEK